MTKTQFKSKVLGRGLSNDEIKGIYNKYYEKYGEFDTEPITTSIPDETELAKNNISNPTDISYQALNNTDDDSIAQVGNLMKNRDRKIYTDDELTERVLEDVGAKDLTEGLKVYNDLYNKQHDMSDSNPASIALNVKDENLKMKTAYERSPISNIEGFDYTDIIDIEVKSTGDLYSGDTAESINGFQLLNNRLKRSHKLGVLGIDIKRTRKTIDNMLVELDDPTLPENTRKRIQGQISLAEAQVGEWHNEYYNLIGDEDYKRPKPDYKIASTGDIVLAGMGSTGDVFAGLSLTVNQIFSIGAETVTKGKFNTGIHMRAARDYSNWWKDKVKTEGMEKAQEIVATEREAGSGFGFRQGFLMAAENTPQLAASLIPNKIVAYGIMASSEGNSMADALYDAGVGDEIGNVIAQVYGAMSGAIEFAEMGGRLTGAFGKKTLTAMSKPVRVMLLNSAKELGFNAVEELTQDELFKVLYNVGVKQHNEKTGDSILLTTRSLQGRYKTAIDSMSMSTVMNTVGIPTTVAKIRKSQKSNNIDKMLENFDLSEEQAERITTELHQAKNAKAINEVLERTVVILEENGELRETPTIEIDEVDSENFEQTVINYTTEGIDAGLNGEESKEYGIIMATIGMAATTQIYNTSGLGDLDRDGVSPRVAVTANTHANVRDVISKLGVHMDDSFDNATVESLISNILNGELSNSPEAIMGIFSLNYDGDRNMTSTVRTVRRMVLDGDLRGIRKKYTEEEIIASLKDEDPLLTRVALGDKFALREFKIKTKLQELAYSENNVTRAQFEAMKVDDIDALLVNWFENEDTRDIIKRAIDGDVEAQQIFNTEIRIPSEEVVQFKDMINNGRPMTPDEFTRLASVFTQDELNSMINGDSKQTLIDAINGDKNAQIEYNKIISGNNFNNKDKFNIPMNEYEVAKSADLIEAKLFPNTKFNDTDNIIRQKMLDAKVHRWYYRLHGKLTELALYHPKLRTHVRSFESANNRYTSELRIKNVTLVDGLATFRRKLGSKAMVALDTAVIGGNTVEIVKEFNILVDILDARKIKVPKLDIVALNIGLDSMKVFAEEIGYTDFSFSKIDYDKIDELIAHLEGAGKGLTVKQRASLVDKTKLTKKLLSMIKGVEFLVNPEDAITELQTKMANIKAWNENITSTDISELVDAQGHLGDMAVLTSTLKNSLVADPDLSYLKPSQFLELDKLISDILTPKAGGGEFLKWFKTTAAIKYISSPKTAVQQLTEHFVHMGEQTNIVDKRKALAWLKYWIPQKKEDTFQHKALFNLGLEMIKDYPPHITEEVEDVEVFDEGVLIGTVERVKNVEEQTIFPETISPEFEKLLESDMLEIIGGGKLNPDIGVIGEGKAYIKDIDDVSKLERADVILQNTSNLLLSLLKKLDSDVKTIGLNQTMRTIQQLSVNNESVAVDYIQSVLGYNRAECKQALEDINNNKITTLSAAFTTSYLANMQPTSQTDRGTLYESGGMRFAGTFKSFSETNTKRLQNDVLIPLQMSRYYLGEYLKDRDNKYALQQAIVNFKKGSNQTGIYFGNTIVPQAIFNFVVKATLVSMGWVSDDDDEYEWTPFNFLREVGETSMGTLSPVISSYHVMNFIKDWDYSHIIEAIFSSPAPIGFDLVKGVSKSIQKDDTDELIRAWKEVPFAGTHAYDYLKAQQ